MSYSIIFTHGYTRRAENFMRRHPELKSQYEKALNLLALNPFHPSLRLHKLKGKLERLHSISINISYRITFEFLMRKNTIIPVNIGSHDEVYD
mgnify:CR=1 FL=1